MYIIEDVSIQGQINDNKIPRASFLGMLFRAQHLRLINEDAKNKSLLYNEEQESKSSTWGLNQLEE